MYSGSWAQNFNLREGGREGGSERQLNLKNMSNKVGVLGTLFVMIIVLSSPLSSLAATHVVGDSQGWGISVSYDSWASGNTFSAGDTLVFNYQSGGHNVVPVNIAGYRSCKATGKGVAASSGNDKFTLKKGANYFICSMPGHCSAGMKILVNAH